jgi:glycosyltransferase involved in cell wall biosynthesis
VRIAHVSDCFAPRTGGIETQVAALAAHQAAEGDDVRVITATPGHGEVFSGDEMVDGLLVHRTAAHLPFELPVHPRTGREVGRVLAQHPVDVVHVHAGVISPYAWGAIRAARKAGIPTLVTVHSIWGPLAGPGFAASDALLRWSRWGATLSAVSDVAAARISASVPGAGQVLVVPNGIDPASWQVAHIPAGATVLRLASVLRMAPRKRTMPLVRILESAVHRLDGVAVSAILVGDGPERAGAEKYVRDRGLGEAIAFAGRLPRQRILDVFARTDAYVQPSVKESFGLAALEARTAGLPIIARSQTGTTQFVHDGVEGLLADDDRGMADAIVRLGRDRRLLDSISRHNSTVEPAEAWPSVLAIVRDAYAGAGARGSE